MNASTINPDIPAALPVFLEHVIAALKKIPGTRMYSLTDADLAALAAASAAWWEAERQKQGVTASFTREQLVTFLKTLVPLIPGMLQSRPSDPTKPLDWPRDPLTNQPVKIEDQTSLNLLAKHNPDLWLEIKRREKSGGVLTYKQLLEDQEAAADAKLVRDLEYGEEQHRANPWVNGSNVTERSDFVRSNPKPIVDYYTAEASTNVRIPWLENNLTDRMQLAKNSELSELLPRTREIQRAWGHETLEEIRRAEADNAQRREAAQRLLAK
jgi:hypothetical protein